jgi:hypothetical protein
MGKEEREKKLEKISDEMVGSSMPCTCGTIIDEMLVNGMDDDLRAPSLKQDSIPQKNNRKDR